MDTWSRKGNVCCVRRPHEEFKPCNESQNMSVQDESQDKHHLRCPHRRGIQYRGIDWWLWWHIDIDGRRNRSSAKEKLETSQVEHRTVCSNVVFSLVMCANLGNVQIISPIPDGGSCKHIYLNDDTDTIIFSHSARANLSYASGTRSLVKLVLQRRSPSSPHLQFNPPDCKPLILARIAGPSAHVTPLGLQPTEDGWALDA